jgi:hypothetical protein
MRHIMAAGLLLAGCSVSAGDPPSLVLQTDSPLDQAVQCVITGLDGVWDWKHVATISGPDEREIRPVHISPHDLYFVRVRRDGDKVRVTVYGVGRFGTRAMAAVANCGDPLI